MKKYLLSLLVVWLTLICFWNCEEINIISSVSMSVNSNGTLNFYPWYCFRTLSSSYWAVYDINWNIVSWQWEHPTNYNCMNFTWYVQNIYSNNRNIDYIDISSMFPSCPICEEQYTSSECQLEYWLMPIENCNSEFCELNNLCSSWNLDLSWNWSALYINDIQHLSAPLIDITIPEEFNWSYTWNDELFELSISWYNVDTAYIDWIIRTQNYKPTSEDFTKLISLFVPYSKYLIFLLFIFIIWVWIKKSFKSKKL